MDRPRSLPESELEIMQAVWRETPPVARSAIEAALAERRPRLAPTTILTFLARLVDKGFLTMEKRGKSNYYTPRISEKDYLAAESRRLLDRLYGGSLSAFAVSLCDGGVSRAEIEELRKMLEGGRL